MSDSGKLIEAFRKELFRWNRQINLVSRKETEDRLAGLFNQCIGGVGPVLNALSSGSSGGGGKPNIHYFDLGSGGGLPGVLWHILFCEKAKLRPAANSEPGNVRTWLVEPREKRAWFLDRLNRIPKMPPFAVLHGRWGEVAAPGALFPCGGAGFPVVVISLKALHLDDKEVLAGLRSVFSSFPGSFRVVIARYYPPEQLFDSELASLLDIPAQGAAYDVDGYLYTGLGGEVAPLDKPGAGQASLVLSSYDVSFIG